MMAMPVLFLPKYHRKKLWRKITIPILQVDGLTHA